MVLGVVLSIVGLFFFLLGASVAVLLPVFPALTGVGHWMANLHLWLGMWLHGRSAWVVDEHDGLSFQPMTFTDPGVEEITIGGETKQFEDPAAAISHWMGFPMALADEVHGVLFDPRHAAIGSRKKRAEEHDEMQAVATETEYEAHGCMAWIRGVFTFPDGQHELTTLSHVRQLITGSERANYPEKIEELYKKSQEPYADSPSMLRLSMPVFAPIIVFGALWLMASYGPDAGSTNTIDNETVEFGLVALLLSLASVREWLSRVRDRLPARETVLRVLKILAKHTALALLVVGPWVALYYLTGVVFTAGALIAYALGFLFIGLILFLGYAVAWIGQGIGALLLRLGFLAYRRPVFVWQPDGYRLRGYRDLDCAGEPHWYHAFGRSLGFTFTPSPDVWEETVPHNTLEAGQEVRADGSGQTNIPVGHSPYPEMQRAEVYRGFVPRRIKDSKYYVHSGIAFQRLRDAALGEKSLRALLEAKDEHGGMSGNIDQTKLLLASAGTSTIAFVTGVFVFFL